MSEDERVPGAAQKWRAGKTPSTLGSSRSGQQPRGFSIYQMSPNLQNMNVQSVALVLSGIVFGCAAGANIATTSAVPSTDGEWRCFKTSLLPEVERAEGLAEGAGYAAALNQLAKSAIPGTLFQMSQDGNSQNFLCVKE